MRVLIFANPKKRDAFVLRERLGGILTSNGIDCVLITDDDLKNKMKADCLIALGGDGTILHVTDFSIRNKIPIIGVNAGKLGFLSEFEGIEMPALVNLLGKKALKKDERLALEVEFRGKKYVALNDAVVQRIYAENISGVVTDLVVSIEDTKLERIIGDGVVISTPTGSTAYSLSAGGAVLAPGINALSLTPIAAHSLCNRAVIFSADLKCSVKIEGGDSAAALFIDGQFISRIKKGETVNIKKNARPVVFLRKQDSNFYDRLVSKLGGTSERN